MSKFNDIITADESQLLQQFYKFRNESLALDVRLTNIAKHLQIHSRQVVCAVGFNPKARHVTEIFPILGYATFNELAQERNDIFTTDIYKRLSLDNVLKIYEVIVTDKELVEVMQYLLKNRLMRIENRIEETVNSMVIEKYKAEMRAVYNGGIAGIDFAEERLDRQDSGFRALLNEVNIIVESKLIPAGEIFFRETIHPQEKQKLLNKGLIPEELIRSRLNEENTDPEEKKILYDYLKAARNSRTE
ncbi:MAG: hypothetical protein WD750_12100 [Gammaproteobacteria bacterium]